MSKISLNFGLVESTAIPSINNVISYINQTISILRQNLIPVDFYRRDTLLNVISSLESYRDNLSKIKTWLLESNNNYELMINKLEAQANKLPVYQIKKRKRKI